MTIAVWPERRIGDLTSMGSGGTPPSKVSRYYGGGIPWVSITDMTASTKYVQKTAKTLSAEGLAASAAKLYEPDVVLYAMYASLGECAIAVGRVSSSQAILGIQPGPNLDREYLFYYLESIKDRIKTIGQQGTQSNLNAGMVRDLRIQLPSVDEQKRVSAALRDADNLISTLERLVAKKQAIKQGMMQQLLTGRTRLPGHYGEWIERDLGSGAVILDNLRIPLSAAQRAGRTGRYPYCGANGVLDYIDDYAIDDDVILLAEDGGNFDQWRTRPIAYRMKGKIWVNNHAHVLKAAPNGDTDFLFYALEHKDITSAISSGTRSKLTRGELVRIKIGMPMELSEQRSIARMFVDVDREIDLLRQRLVKGRAIKQGMMQQLLRGRTRLTVAVES